MVKSEDSRKNRKIPINKLKSFSLILIAVLFLIFYATGIVSAEQALIVGFDFEDAAKRNATDPTDFFYTADEGIPENKDVSEIRLYGASFTAFVVGSGGSGTNAPNSNNWPSGDDYYWYISFSTNNYRDLTLSSKQRGSNTGPRDFKVQWSLDGSDWEDVAGSEIMVANNFTSGVIEDVSLPIEMENQDTVYLRWIKTSNTSVNGGTVGSAGTNRIDDIRVDGEPLTYTIEYSGNGETGGTVPENQTKNHGVALVLHSNTGSLVKTGYAFTGWNTAADGTGTLYAEGGSFTEDADTTLYAHWTPISYNVRFDKNHDNAVGTMADQTFEYDAPQNLTMNAFSLLGHSFSGWTTPADGSGVVYTDGEEVNNLTAIDDDIVTLYAQWAEEVYTVIYGPGDYGTFEAETTENLAYGAPTPPAPDVTGEDGYTFIGWSPEWSDIVTGDVTYTALWSQEGPVVFYHIYGGGGNINGVYRNDFVVLTNIGTEPVQLDGWMIGYASYQGTIWASHGPLDGLICPGGYYVVRAWAGADSEQPMLPYFHADFPLLAIHRQQYKMSLSDHTNRVVDFIGTGDADEYLGSGAAPATADSGERRNQESVIRDLGQPNPYSGNNNLDYTVQWPTDLSYLETQTYTVFFDENSGDIEAVPQYISSIMHGDFIGTFPEQPQKQGYSFVSWNTAADGSGTVFDQNTEVTACLIVYAQWEQDLYSVTFEPGTRGTFSPQTVTGLVYGDATPSPPVITGQEGYAFTGWSPVLSETVTESVTYVAQWRRTDLSTSDPTSDTGVVTPSHILTLYLEGKGAVSPGIGQHTYLKGTAVKLEATANEGWLFLEWLGPVKDPEKPSTIVTMDKNVEVTAVFKKEYKERDIQEESEPPVVIGLAIGSKKALVNDVESIMDVAPYLNFTASRTMIPARFFGEYLGAEVHWLSETRQVRTLHGNTEIIVTIGSDIALVNGEEVALDCPVELLDSRTFVPLRFMSEMLGAVVHWEGKRMTITITR